MRRNSKVRGRVGLGAGIITLILALSCVSAVPAAFADGDPASDVLSTSTLFDPPDAQVPYKLEAQLDAELKASAAAGFAIRVALIDSSGDLGTVTSLFGHPAEYAGYLQRELSLLFTGQVLVVMPQGFGLHGPASGPHALARSSPEDGVTAEPPAAGAQLARSALSAIPLLAKADGHPIPSSTVHVQDQQFKAPATPWTVWLVLGLGLLLLVIAWRASLRARPLRLRTEASA